MSNKNIINIILILVVVTSLIMLAFHVKSGATESSGGHGAYNGCCVKNRN